jgi:glucose-1-phosphate adenylyltransferase
MAINTLALVLAGGEGQRLRPLTEHRAKPAVPFVDGYRIVDFVIANLVNSGVPKIYVLAQYKPAELIQHLHEVWQPVFSHPDRVLEVVLPQGAPYAGTVGAVHRNLRLVGRHHPDTVAVFAADHIYRMDVGQMLGFHRDSEADVTVAAIRVPIERASAFGVISTDASHRIETFDEKPANPRAIPGDPRHAYASMGNYLFKPGVLARLVEDTLGEGGTDFGRHVMPSLPASGYRALAYDFAENEIPGLRSHEERAYWRDVGTLEALAEARHDSRGPQPKIDLENQHWPIGPTAAAQRGAVVW